MPKCRKEIDLQYAVAAALVRRAMRANDSAEAGSGVRQHPAITPARFPQREMGVMLVSDMHRAIGQPLFAVPEFSEWANTIADLMLYEYEMVDACAGMNFDQKEIETKLVCCAHPADPGQALSRRAGAAPAARGGDADGAPPPATDARAFYYNPEFIDNLTLEQTQFVLAHEALHCALCHFARRSHRVKRRWDVACDHAINPMLVEEGLKPPPGALLLERLEGMTAEEIYPCIRRQQLRRADGPALYDSESGGEIKVQDGRKRPEPEPQQDGSGRQRQGEQRRKAMEADGAFRRDSRNSRAGMGGAEQRERPPALNDHGSRLPQNEELCSQWQQRMAAAAQQATAAGKMGGVLARMVDDLLQPQAAVAHAAGALHDPGGAGRLQLYAPSRREGQMICPSLRSGQADMVVALDTSGSVGDEELGEFLAEVDALKGQIRARITLHACDQVWILVARGYTNPGRR